MNNRVDGPSDSRFHGCKVLVTLLICIRTYVSRVESRDVCHPRVSVDGRKGGREKGRKENRSTEKVSSSRLPDLSQIPVSTSGRGSSRPRHSPPGHTPVRLRPVSPHYWLVPRRTVYERKPSSESGDWRKGERVTD